MIKGSIMYCFLQEECVVTAHEVRGKVDYKKLVEEFGCSLIPEELIERIERVTGVPAHPFLKRGIFYAHRDLDKMLDLYEAGKKFYLYTGTHVYCDPTLLPSSLFSVPRPRLIHNDCKCTFPTHASGTFWLAWRALEQRALDHMMSCMYRFLSISLKSVSCVHMIQISMKSGDNPLPLSA
jgi:hypothetical protein